MRWNELGIDVEGLQDFRNAQLALTKADRNLPREFSKSMFDVARAMRDMAREQALSEPTERKGHTGLRRRVSRGVRLVRVDQLTLRITTQMPDSDEAIIPRGMDGNRGWRHPVFGNKKRWVRQRSGTDSWFLESMKKGRKPLENQLQQNLAEAAREIGRVT